MKNHAEKKGFPTPLKEQNTQQGFFPWINWKSSPFQLMLLLL